MDAEDRALFLGGIGGIAVDNLKRQETRAAFLAVAENLAGNFGSASAACSALMLVINYGQAVAAEAYDSAREAPREQRGA